MIQEWNVPYTTHNATLVCMVFVKFMHFDNQWRIWKGSFEIGEDIEIDSLELGALNITNSIKWWSIFFFKTQETYKNNEIA